MYLAAKPLVSLDMFVNMNWLSGRVAAALVTIQLKHVSGRLGVGHAKI